MRHLLKPPEAFFLKIRPSKNLQLALRRIFKFFKISLLQENFLEKKKFVLKIGAQLRNSGLFSHCPGK